MSRISSKRRKLQIKIKRQRKKKLAKLRQQFLVAKTEGEKEKILKKVEKIAPWLSKEEFLAPVKAGLTTKK